MIGSFSDFLIRLSKGSGSALMILRDGKAGPLGRLVSTRLPNPYFLDAESLTVEELEGVIERKCSEAVFMVVTISRESSLPLIRHLDYYLRENRFRFAGSSGTLVLSPHPKFRLAVVAEAEALHAFPEFFQKTDFRFRGTLSVFPKVF